MATKKLTIPKDYDKLVSQIGKSFDEAKTKALKAVGFEMLVGYWEIGKHIVKFEQEGADRAGYGKQLLIQLSKDLSHKFGRGFSRSNLTYMRLLYSQFPKKSELSHKLTWSHYTELLKIEDDLERTFYHQQSVAEAWSVRELKRQKDTSLFHRLAISKTKDEVLALAKQGQVMDSEKAIIRDPYIFEFLGLPETNLYSESDLEERLINSMQQFLLELGQGFAFIGRQYRITLNSKHYRVDLVFYHRILKCFVLLDLKVRGVSHEDVGQMNMYLNYFKTEENVEGDGAPIGIILAAEKDDILVEYATAGISNKLFVSKYKLLLPDKAQLRAQLRAVMEEEIETDEDDE